MTDTDTQFALLGCRLNAAKLAGVLTPPEALGLERLSLSSQVKAFPNDHVVRFLSSGKKDDVKIRLCLWHMLWQIIGFLPDGKRAYGFLFNHFPAPTPQEWRLPTIYAAGTYLGNYTVSYPPNEKIEIVKHATTQKLLDEIAKPSNKGLQFEHFIAWQAKRPDDINTHILFTLLPEVKMD